MEPGISTSDQPSRLLDLSRQQRNFLLMRPLFELELHKLQYVSPTRPDKRLFENIDTSYLVLSLLDDLMEAVAVESGRTTKEVVSHLSKIALELRSDLDESESTRIAEIVLESLSNRSHKSKDFEYVYFDARAKLNRTCRFKLIEYTPDISDVFRFVPTREGYLVYLGMLDLSPEDSAELMEKMLLMLIERGRFSDAIEIAKKARTLSIELGQIIRETIVRARRSPRSVDWQSDVDPKIIEARNHVVKRQSEDGRMTDSVRTSLANTSEIDVRKNLIDLKVVLQSASKLRTKLLHDIMCTHEQFMVAHRNIFKIKTASNLPDLDGSLYPELMKLPVSFLSGIADNTISSLLPASVSRVFDLSSITMILLERRELEENLVDVGGVIEALPELDKMFSIEENNEAMAWLVDQLETLTRSSTETLLTSALQSGLSSRVCQCIALMLYRSFSKDSKDIDFEISIDDAHFELTFVSGRNLIFERKRKVVS